MSKILNNKEALLAILDRKTIKTPDNIYFKYSDNEVLAKYTGRMTRERAFSMNSFGEFVVVEPERETITFYEHICDRGHIIFLTEDNEYLSFYRPNNVLNEISYSEKCRKLYRNGICQEVKVYADTLEYVQEGE